MYFLFDRSNAGSTVFALQELTFQPAPLVATPRYIDTQAFVNTHGELRTLAHRAFFQPLIHMGDTLLGGCP